MPPVAIDPFAPKGIAGPSGERESQLATFLRRLRLLGATPEMVDDVATNWDNFDADWTPKSRTAFARQSDEALRLHVEDVRHEWTHDTTTEADQRSAERDAAWRTAITELEGIIGGNVASVIEWVGDSPVRALAVTALEGAPDGANRRTLLAAVGPLADQWNADAPRA